MKHILSKNCPCHPAVIKVEKMSKTEKAFTDYANGEISLERCAELVGVNFYTLHAAMCHFKLEQHD